MKPAMDGEAAVPDELAAVRHLIELGYEDPLDVAARRDAEERGRQEQLSQAQGLIDAGQLSAAIEFLERLAGESPDWSAPRRRLAFLYYQSGNLDAARSCLEWLEFHGVEHADLSLLRAKLFLLQRRLADACEQAEYARWLHEPLPAADVVLGEVYFRRGDLQAAEADYRRGLSQQPDARALAGLAAVSLRRGDYELAVDWSLQSLEREMRLPSAHYRLGLALWYLGRCPEARVALETAAALNPRLAGPYRWLVEISRCQGDESQAADYRRRGQEAIARRRAGRSRE